MPNKQLATFFLDQSNDLIWIIDSNFCLKYANHAFQNMMKQFKGAELKIDEPVLTEGLEVGTIEKWKVYYERGLNGEHFDIEDQFYNPYTNQVVYNEISFKPLKDENQVVVNVACQSRDITSYIKSNTEGEKLLDASLDVICSIDEWGNFTKVSAACKELWGYEKHELVGKPYISFVIEEDVEKTNETAATIISGKNVTTFENRYKRKDGSIAYNLWSVRYDHKNKILFCVARDAREKIQKEELLIESENRFKALVQEGADMISIIDVAGNYRYTSPTTTGILGITPEEVDGNSVFDFIHPDDIEKSAGYMQRIMTENKVIVEPFRLRDGNNEWRWIETVLTNMLDNPAVNGIVANSRDITEEKKLEKLNKQTNNLGKIGTWEYDLIENKLFWSDEVYYLHDLEPGTFVPNVETAIDFYKEEHKSYVTDEITKSLTQGVYLDYEAVVITKSKKEKWVRVVGSPEFIDEKCVKFIGSFQDTTEIREAEFRLQSLSDNLPGVVYQYIIHPDGTDSMQFISGMVEKLWGYTTNEVMQNIDLLWDQIKQGGDIEEVKSSIAKSIETKSKWTCRFKIINRAGEIRTHFGSGTPIFLADGTIIFHVMVLDITQEAKNEELLKEVTNIAKIGSWEVDLINNSIFWSEITHEIHETPEHFEPQLSEAINFYREDFREIATKSVNTCIETGTPFDFEAILVTNKNNEVWVRAIGRAKLVDGKCVRIFGSFQDIHERKESQLELLKAKELAEENEHKMKQAQKLAHLGSWYYDVVNQVSQWSEETYNIWGLNPDSTSVDFVDHQKLIHPKDWERFNAVIKNAIEKGIPYKMDLELVRPDGSYKTVNTIGDPIFDENNKVIAFEGTTQDISDRVIIENELRSAIKKAQESDARFKSYTQQSPIAIYTTDTNGDCIYANETWLEMAGMQLEDALGKGWINALHPEDLEYVTYNWYKSIESNGEWNYEYRFLNSKKNITWVNGNAKKLFNDKNELIGYLGSNVNITERKKAEQEKNSLLTTLEKSLNEIYIFDAETLKFSYVNQGALNNIGYSEQEIKELTPLDLKPDHTRTTFNFLIAPLKRKEKEKIIFFTNHIRKNGSLYPVEVHLQLVTEGNEKRFLAVILDITERKKAEEEDRFKANLLSTIGQAAIGTNLDGTVNYWNKAAENIYGWKKEEVLGRNIMDLMPIENNKLKAEEIMESLKNGQTWTGEFQVKRKDGTSFLAMVDNSPIYNEQNILSGIIGISSDISEKVNNELLLKQYTLELERSNEELEQFAFVASHDLQEPLRMITSFMDQLKRKYDDRLDEKGLQYIHFATDGAKRMKQIILDLLLYSRANKPIEQNELININELVSEYTQSRRKVIAEKRAIITFHNLPTIETCQAPITQVFHCLLDNALKYMDKNKPPRIEISAIEKEDVWQFAIKDNGIGIDPKFFEKIFVIFQRLQNRREHDGNGIGLAVAKRSVEYLGGEIWLESEIHKGSTFYFTISKNKKPT